jgi:hypothetical protein
VTSVWGEPVERGESDSNLSVVVSLFAGSDDDVQEIQPTEG